MDPMKKPFDKDDLIERLKSKGLTAVEGLADIVLEETFAWTQDSLMHPHTNSLVRSIGIPALGIIKPLAEGLVEKIDGQA